MPRDVLDVNPVELPFVLKKRLGLALANLTARPWIILDEPTIGQDVEARLQIGEILKLLIATQRGLIVISHDPGFKAMFPTARNLFLRDGTVYKDA